MSFLHSDVHSTSSYMKFLMDSSVSAFTIHDSFVRTNEFDTRKTTSNKWSLMAESCLTSYKAEVKIKLPQVNVTARILTSKYNVIFGRDLLRELGINSDFHNNVVGWKETKMTMKSINFK